MPKKTYRITSTPTINGWIYVLKLNLSSDTLLPNPSPNDVPRITNFFPSFESRFICNSRRNENHKGMKSHVIIIFLDDIIDEYQFELKLYSLFFNLVLSISLHNDRMEYFLFTFRAASAITFHAIE